MVLDLGKSSCSVPSVEATRKLSAQNDLVNEMSKIVKNSLFNLYHVNQ